MSIEERETQQRHARPSSADLIEAARTLVPALRERADRTDRERRVPDESLAAMQGAGLFRSLKPATYGGFEYGLVEHAGIALELARGCGSSGWVFSMINETSWFIALFPEQAQDEVWAEDGAALAAASIITDPQQAQARRVPGGYRLNGRFGFASGSDHAQWLVLSAVVAAEAAQPDESAVAHWFLVPKGELGVDDDWYVLGLRGSGSRTMLADDLFVPAHRAAVREDLWQGRAPGPALHPDFALLHTPRAQLSPFPAASSVVGLTLGAVELFAEIAQGVRRWAGSGRRAPIGDSEAVQLQYAESAAEAYAARLLLEAGVRDQMACVDARLPVPHELRTRVARDNGFAGILCRRAVSRLHTAAGSAGIFDGHPLQRALRDVHTGVAQISMHWEVMALPYAQHAFGRDA